MRSTWFAIAVALGLATCAQAQDSLSVKQGRGELSFYAGPKLITTYQFQAEKWTRPFFYPVHAPNGVSLTRSWPMVADAPGETKDHPHQKSAWFTHGDVVAEGMPLKNARKGIAGSDFWAEPNADGKARINCTSVEVKKQDRDLLVIVTKNEWIDNDGRKILDETRTIHVRKIEGAYLITVESDLFASVTTIVFEDTKEGSFGVRINDTIAGKTGKGKIQNADGKIGEKACWGNISDWCDYSGPIDGKVAGIAILADPKNPSPTCWHVREYGLMAANPFGRTKSGFPAMKGRNDLVRVEKGQHSLFRYAYVLHDGDANAGRVADVYRQFVAQRGK